jgi:hypothetical protein
LGHPNLLQAREDVGEQRTAQFNVGIGGWNAVAQTREGVGRVDCSTCTQQTVRHVRKGEVEGAEFQVNSTHTQITPLTILLHQPAQRHNIASAGGELCGGPNHKHSRVTACGIGVVRMHRIEIGRVIEFGPNRHALTALSVQQNDGRRRIQRQTDVLLPSTHKHACIYANLSACKRGVWL